MDRKPFPVRIPLHSDVSLLAQRRRELLCETHQKAPQARRVPLPPGTQRCHPPLPRRHQCKPKALYLDQAPQQNHRGRQARAPNVRFDPLGLHDAILGFDHRHGNGRWSKVYRKPSLPTICSLVSPPTRGRGRPLSVTTTATTISLLRGASCTRTSIASKWLRTNAASLWPSGTSMAVPGPPIFFAEGIRAAPFSTAARNGLPSFGCRIAAACSSSPCSPTIAALP